MGIIPTFLEFLVSFVFVVERCYDFASVVEWGIDIGDYFRNASFIPSSMHSPILWYIIANVAR